MNDKDQRLADKNEKKFFTRILNDNKNIYYICELTLTNIYLLCLATDNNR